MMKVYNNAPLPFMGQKRRFLNEFRAALRHYPENGLYVDLFGGSGLLAHNVKRMYPDARVIYNDYDNYCQRIINITKTNRLLNLIRGIAEGLPKDKVIREPHRSQILAAIDPPYLSTECGVYNNYWRLTDYLDVLDTLKTNNYFYFTSNKSSIVELCDWVATKTGGVNPFAGATVKMVNTSMNYAASYTDIMLFKCQNVG